MHTNRFRLIPFILLVLILPAVLLAADGRRLEILFMGDQGHHKPSARYPELIRALGVHGINFTYTENMADLNPKTLGHYDGLLLYANIGSITPEQEKAVLDYVDAGRAFIPIHCATYCWRNSKAMVELMGAQFKSHKVGTFFVPVWKEQKNHPVVKDFKGFETWDETYVHHLHNEKNRTVLQYREEGDHREPWTWVRSHGKGRVFYTAYGHDERTWKQAGFQDLVKRGIVWAVSDEARAAWRALHAPEFKYEKRDTVQNYEKRDPYPQFQLPLSPAESKKHTQWPAEFKLELFASEPDIVKPIYLQWDHRGRAWIAETIDYPNQVNDDRKGNDRIKICEDTDGDGKADKFTVFADGLNIPTSLVFANGGVIVSAAPHFYFLKDTNGDDVADEKKIISTGWGVGDTHAGPSNLKYGFDNFYYGCVGYSAYNEKGTRFGSGIYRFKPDFSYIEFLGQFSNNSWGLGFSESFDLFGSTANNTHSCYVGIPIRHYKGIKGMSAPRAKKIDGHYEAHPLTEKIRQVDVHGGYTAVAGHNLYTARSFPKEFWNRSALVAAPTMHLLHNAVLEPDGAGFREVNGWNLLASADEWFSPIHADVGPDGAVWVIDWYNFIIQHNPTPNVNRGGFAGKRGKGNAHENPLRDKQRGRIWRLVWKDAPDYEPVKLDANDPKSLVAALSHDNLFWRLTAQRLLIERGNPDVRGDLEQVIQRTASQSDAIGINAGVIHALYTLSGLKAVDHESPAAIVGMAGKSPGVRKAAVAVLPRTHGSASSMVAVGILKDPDLNVRKDALLAFAEMPPSLVTGKALYALKDDKDIAGDEWLRDAFAIAVARHNLGYLAAAAEGMKAPAAPKEKKPEPKPVELLVNGSFETVSGKLPKNWKVRTYSGKAEHRVVKAGRDGGFCLEFESPGADTSLFQDVNVEPGATYKLSGWIKTEARQAKGRGGDGICFNVHVADREKSRTPPLRGKNDWTFVERTIKMDGRKRASINVLFGAWGWMEGKAWFDDVSLVKTEGGMAGAPAGMKLESLAAQNADPDELQVLVASLDPAARKKFEGLVGLLGVKPPAGAEKVDRVVRLSVIKDVLKFDRKGFTVKAGERVKLIFNNIDHLVHNVVIGKPGSLEKIGTASLKMVGDDFKKAESNQYVPDIPEVLWATGLVQPQELEALVFTAPAQGAYPFVCTFPGHWMIMNGVMKVE